MRLWEPKRKCPKAVPRHLQHHVVWSRTLECSVKSYVTGPSTKCYFYEFLFMRVLTHDKNRINQRLWAFGMSWSPGFMLGLLPRGGFWKQSKWPWNLIHSMPCKNPRRLYIHLAFTCILRWSLKRSVKRQTWTGSAFSTNESAWSVMVTGSRSRVWCEVTLSTSELRLLVFFFSRFVYKSVIHLELQEVHVFLALVASNSLVEWSEGM